MPVSIDDKVTKLKELSDQRDGLSTQIATLQDEIRAELSSLMGQFSPIMKARGNKGVGRGAGPKKCGICGQQGHNARSCPQRDVATAKAPKKNVKGK